MMTKKEIAFTVEVYSTAADLTPGDASLLQAAREVTSQAYAPYSNFRVGAVAVLTNGQRVMGTNQENASYPVGICAERVLLSCIASQFPGVPVHTIAISYDNGNGDSDHPISPCGICRQSLAEYEERVKQPIRLIMGGMTGSVQVLEKAHHLLPLHFSASDLG